jgi:murein DD-endopeptidase MepM/ murein hydrolase activator NlpD
MSCWKRSIRDAATALVLLTSPAIAQLSSVGGGPIQMGPLDNNHAEIDAVHRASVAQSRALGPAMAPRARTPILQFPVRLRSQSKAISGHHIANYVDLDATAKLKDFTCGRRTYDGHNGTDFVLSPFWWRMMDGKEAEVVAAAPGRLINKNDGNFDRQCNFSGASPGNYVVIEQDDGHFAYYFHMKKGFVTPRSIGSRVAAGDVLGLVGSSGTSLLPHLHFELRTASGFINGQTVDPFAGTCGATKTLWRHQPENLDTEIIRVATHRVVPPNAHLDFCSNPDPGYSDRFLPGAQVWVAAYVRDQPPNTPLNFKVLRPDGTIFESWASSPLSQVEPFTYSFGQIDIPAAGPPGRWKVQVQLQGKTAEHVFMVGALPAPTTLATSVTPVSVTATPSAPANLEVVVRNTGITPAIGCSVAPDAPLAAVSRFQVTVGGIPRGAVNEAFDISAGTAKRIRLTIAPKTTYHANQIELPIRVFCANGSEPAAARAKLVTLSF